MVGRRQDGAESKKNIALKAKELFSIKGYAATSMEEIRQATGMSKGSIYYHFASKEALFLYLLELSMQEWIEAWKHMEGKCDSAQAKLYALADHFVEDFQNPLMKAAEEFMGSQSADEEVLAKLLELTKAPHPVFIGILEEGMRSGEFAEDDLGDLSYIVHGLLGGLGTAYYEKNKDELRKLYRKGIDVLLNGIKKE